MELVVVDKGVTRTVLMAGELRFSDHASVRNLIDDFEMPRYHSFEMSLKNLDFIDSAGLGMLMLMAEAAEKNGVKFQVMDAVGRVKKILDHADANNMLNVIS